MMHAMQFAKEGRDADVEKMVNRAFECLALTSSFAADVYRRAREKAVRTNRRKPGRRAPQ